MTPQKDLHQLIHSLTKTEKRYFSLFAQRHVIGEENKYIRLFNCIEKQDAYDETLVKKCLNDQKSFVNLAVEKVNLRELILKALKQFHTDSTIDSELYSRLVQIEILYAKGLYNIGYPLLKKALDMAEKYQKMMLRSKILLWKITYDIKLNRFVDLHSDFRKIDHDLTCYNEYLEYLEGNFRMIALVKKLGDSEISKDAEQIIHLYKELKKKPKPQTLLGEYYYYSIRALVSDTQKAHKETIGYFEKSLAVFKKHSFFLEDRPNLYFISINNFIVSLIENGQLPKAEEELDLFEKTVENADLTNQLRARAFMIVSDNKLFLLQKKNNWPDALLLSKDIEQKFDRYEKYIDPHRKTDLFFTLANACFFAKDFRMSSRYLNRIIGFKGERDVNEFSIVHAQVSLLVTMIEAKDTLLLTNKIRSARRLASKNPGMSWYSEFINLIPVFDNNVRPRDKKIIAKAKSLAEKAVTDQNLIRMNNYFDLKEWLLKKI